MVSQKKICRLITGIILFWGFIFLLWRAPYGFCFNDEGFYVTLAQRMYHGDALIADEWHGTQNLGPVLLPLYALFRLFSASNEGVLLFLRYAYCLLWWGTCFIVYRTLAKQYKGAILAFVYLIFFSPADYMNVSYNSVGLMSVLLLCCLLYSVSSAEIQDSRVRILLFSALWILLTLCSPFMAAAYVCGCVLCLCFDRIPFLKKWRSCGIYFRNISVICKFSVVIVGITAVIYVYIFSLSRTSLSEIFASIPLILADPEHSSISLLRSMTNVPRLIFLQYPVYCAVSGIVFLVGMFLKCKKVRLLLFAICTGLFVYGQLTLDIWNIYSENLIFNTQVLYVVILGAVAFSLLEKRPYKLFGIFWSFACVYAVVSNLTSNTGLMTISMALSVAGVCSMVCIALLAEELLVQYNMRSAGKAVSVAVICIALIGQFSVEIGIRFHRTFWDEPLYTLTETITDGAAKGLTTNPFHSQRYRKTYENLTLLLEQTETEGKSFLCCTSAPYIYLDANLRMETFSAWSFGYGENLDERILDYQKLQGEQPDLIFCASEEDILPKISEGYEVLEHNGAYLFVKNR